MTTKFNGLFLAAALFLGACEGADGAAPDENLQCLTTDGKACNITTTVTTTEPTVVEPVGGTPTTTTTTVTATGVPDWCKINPTDSRDPRFGKAGLAGGLWIAEKKGQVSWHIYVGADGPGGGHETESTAYPMNSNVPMVENKLPEAVRNERNVMLGIFSENCIYITINEGNSYRATIKVPNFIAAGFTISDGGRKQEATTVDGWKLTWYYIYANGEPAICSNPTTSGDFCRYGR
jgi:hypothetical protein